MRGVSQALLFALSSAGTLGARTSPSFPRVNVIQSISSLLQKHNKNTKVIDEIVALANQAPGATDTTLNSVLQTVIDAIKDIEKQVKTAFTSLQADCNASILNVETTTNHAVEMYQTAKTHDDTWFECVRAQWEKLKAIEEAQSDLSDAERSVTTECQRQDDLSPFSATIEPSTFTFSCDNSKENDCTEQLNNFETSVNEMVQKVKDDMSTKQADYNAAKTNCDHSEAVHVQAQSSLNAAESDFVEQQATCGADHEQRSLAICQFGTALQNKCASVSAFRSFLANVDKTDGALSLSAMQSEWNTVFLTRCMLEKVVSSGSAVDETALSQCENTHDFHTQVGEFHRHEDKLDILTSAENFTCDETQITFRGQTWEIAETAGSSGYKVVDWSPALDLSADVAFDFCNPAEPGKE